MKKGFKVVGPASVLGLKCPRCANTFGVKVNLGVAIVGTDPRFQKASVLPTDIKCPICGFDGKTK